MVLTGADLIRGPALSMGMKLIDVPGATGYIDTNYAGKGSAAVGALGEYDPVAGHVEAPDEAAHHGNADEKVKAIEQIDRLIVGPLLETLRAGAQKGRETDAWPSRQRSLRPRKVKPAPRPHQNIIHSYPASPTR